ncbi:MAG TPA: hypothetical protein VFW70_13780 [Methylomirabilota bacterium]|jgi:hypothetical protein|nr:hypothetical protein [Methylomirabilota bacterium]
MKKVKVKRKERDELRPEYKRSDFGTLVRGKYYKRAMAGTNLVLLEPDVARVFPNSDAVNRALRLLCDVAMKSSRRTKPGANGRRRIAG